MYKRVGFYLLMMFGASTSLGAQTVRIHGPANVAKLSIPRAVDGTVTRLGSLHAAQLPSKPGTWKSALIIGGITAVVAGVAIAAMPGDEGGTRTTSNRVKSGVVGGLVVAIPVTVIFVLLAGDG
jgi:hypothetical protein